MHSQRLAAFRWSSRISERDHVLRSVKMRMSAQFLRHYRKCREITKAVPLYHNRRKGRLCQCSGVTLSVFSCLYWLYESFAQMLILVCGARD